MLYFYHQYSWKIFAGPLFIKIIAFLLYNFIVPGYSESDHWYRVLNFHRVV